MISIKYILIKIQILNYIFSILIKYFLFFNFKVYIYIKNFINIKKIILKIFISLKIKKRDKDKIINFYKKCLS